MRIPADPPDSTLRTTTTPLPDEEETRTAKAAVRATDFQTTVKYFRQQETVREETRTAKAAVRATHSARVVGLPHADHYVYESNEADVLREMNAFIAGLP